MEKVKVGDRIICKCERNPRCRASSKEFQVEAVDKDLPLFIRADDEKHSYPCSNFPQAAITIVNKG